MLCFSQRWGFGEAKSHVGMDSYTFCTALGPEEANRQLRRHWGAWLNESHVKQLHEQGVRHIRIPVGDWMFVPYEPYVGCWDGSVEELDRVLSYLRNYNMTALLDVHAVKDSANGLDNGGHSLHVRWGQKPDPGTGHVTFNHYDYRTAHWLGPYNITTKIFGPVNYANINHSILVMSTIINKYKAAPEVFGLQPGNVPHGLDVCFLG